MAADWDKYQEEAAEFFRSLGLEASTNVTLRGVHTTHDVDVVVVTRQAGFEVKWIVECKYWNSRVKKGQVLALRQIVTDLGADRGILLAENGFQSGAAEAAALTNVHLTSLAAARQSASNEVFAMRLSEIYDRVEVARDKYWSIPKHIRIEHGLRPDVMESGFSGAGVISLAEDVLRKGLRGSYPFEVDVLYQHAHGRFPTVILSVQELISQLEPIVRELEGRLDAYLAVVKQTGA